MKRDIAIVLISDITGKASWLHRSGIPHRIYERISRDNSDVTWIAHRPCVRYPLKEHDHYVVVENKFKVKEHLKKFARTLRPKKNEVIQGKFVRVCGYDETIGELISLAESKSADRLVLVYDDDVALLPEGIDLALRLHEERHADLVASLKLNGIIPTVVSVKFLKRWAAREQWPNPHLLKTPNSLSEIGSVHDVELVDEVRLPGVIRVKPADHREYWLAEYWEERSGKLGEALRGQPEVTGSGRRKLEEIISEYRLTVAPGLETYHVVGTLHDVEELRRVTMTTKKPLIDYFVIATHYVRFLQAYAGLTPDSHVIDIGCSWGYLAFALAGVLNQGKGRYLGIEIQQEAVEWAKHRLEWLGDRFCFHYMDVHNDYYNPDGSTPRDRVFIPVDDRWADVIIAGSVFTHMQKDGVISYLKEFKRVLRPKGVAAFSYDDTTYWGSREDYLIMKKEVPDEATAYSREMIARMIAEAGMRIAREPVNMRQFDRTDYQTWYFVTPGK